MITMRKLFLSLLLVIFIGLSGCSSNAPTEDKIQAENSSGTQQAGEKEYAESSMENDMNADWIFACDKR